MSYMKFARIDCNCNVCTFWQKCRQRNFQLIIRVLGGISAGFIPKIACMSGSAQGMQSLVAAGLGIALLPRLAISPPEGSVLVELESPRPTRTLAAIWRPDRLSHSARAFLSSLLGNVPSSK